MYLDCVKIVQLTYLLKIIIEFAGLSYGLYELTNLMIVIKNKKIRK